MTYKGVLVGDYEADLVVEDKIILELKAVSTLHPRHEAQAINYLTATGYRLAILLNPSADTFAEFILSEANILSAWFILSMSKCSGQALAQTHLSTNAW